MTLLSLLCHRSYQIALVASGSCGCVSYRVLPCICLPPSTHALGCLMIQLLTPSLRRIVAVLLEHRVLLRCRHYRLMVLVAEALRQLLYPFTFLHVYIPVLPYVLLDYIEVRAVRTVSGPAGIYSGPAGWFIQWADVGRLSNLQAAVSTALGTWMGQSRVCYSVAGAV